LAQVLRDEINLLRAAIPHPITSITRVTTVATVTTPTAHGLTVGRSDRDHGRRRRWLQPDDDRRFGGEQDTVFTYAMANAGTTPATGSMFYTLGAVPQMGARTLAQVVAAIKAKIAATAE
jgi:hypothetical protein